MAKNPFAISSFSTGSSLFGGGSEKKRRPIDKNIRSLVWQKYNGSSLAGKCYVCKRPITFDHFEIGHNKAVAKGGKDNINNLRPICGPCNRGMGTMSIEQYKEKYFGNKSKTKSAKKPRKKRSSSSYSMLGSMPKMKLPKFGL